MPYDEPGLHTADVRGRVSCHGEKGRSPHNAIGFSIFLTDSASNTGVNLGRMDP